MKNLSSSELKTGFAKLEDNAFWQIYRERLQGEFDRVQQTLISNASAEADTIRVCASLMSAFQTALDLPQRIVEQVETDEELKGPSDGKNEE